MSKTFQKMFARTSSYFINFFNAINQDAENWQQFPEGNQAITLAEHEIIGWYSDTFLDRTLAMFGHDVIENWF